MDTARLCRHYGNLTPHERVPLIMAATLRGDEVERQRLIDSAPLERFAFRNYHGYALALSEAATCYRIGQLELLARYLHRMLEGSAIENAKRTAHRVATAKDAPDDVLPLQTGDFIIFEAYAAWLQYRRNREGFAIFCREMSVDPDALISTLNISEEMKRIEAELLETDLDSAGIPQLAADLTNPDTAAQLSKAMTAEEIAARWRQFVDEKAREWE